MFGFSGLPDMTEMVRQVEDWKNKLERLVQAVEKTQRDIALIKEHFKIDDPNVPETYDPQAPLTLNLEKFND